MEQKSSGLRISLILLFTAYFFSAYFKISASIVLPIFQRQLNLSSTMVGFLSSAFYIPYAMGQLFSGALCVRYGSHRVMAAGCITAAVGTALSAFATLPIHIAVSRFCMGLGVGPSFVVVINMVRENYSGKKFAKVSGFAIMMCNLGGACASAPLKYLLDILGMKTLFVLLTALQVFMAFGLLIADHYYFRQENVADNKGTFKQLLLGIKTLFTTPVLTGSALFWCSFNLFLAIYQGLWAGEWTVSVFPDFGDMGLLSGLWLAIGICIGSLFGDDLKLKNQTRQKTVLIDAWVQYFAFISLIIVKNLGCSGIMLFASLTVDFLYGMLIGMLCVELTAYIKESTDSNLSSVIVGITACTPNICAQPVQWFSGAMVDLFAVKHSMRVSYSLTFIVLAAVFCIFMVFGTKKLKSQKIC